MSNTPDNTFRATGNSLDVMGREWSTHSGYAKAPLIPIGSRVRIHKASYGNSLMAKFYVGVEAVVTSDLRPSQLSTSDAHVISLRFVEPQSDWKLLDNKTNMEPQNLEVLAVGNGTVIPGVSYRLCEKEIWDARFAAHDFRHGGYVNLPTFLAATYLKQEPRHVEAVRRMLRKDQTINPVRLETYFKKEKSLKVDDHAWFQGTFPERSEYRLSVNWAEIAAEFDESYKEERSFA